MLFNPLLDSNEGKYRGGEGETPATPRLVQKAVEGGTSHGLSWKVKLITNNNDNAGFAIYSRIKFCVSGRKHLVVLAAAENVSIE